MKYKLQDLIDIDHFQILQDKLTAIYSFPSSIIDNDGNILTATAWQDICTKFHRKNKDCEKECIKSDQYILSHLHEANPAVSYRCPHGLIDNATPIIIYGVHYGNFFTGQFFLEPPDLAFFREQAKKYGFDENAYLQAVQKVPVWSQEQLDNYLFFINGLIAIISESGLKNLREIEHIKQIEEHMHYSDSILQTAMDGFWITDNNGSIIRVNDTYSRMSGYTAEELLNMHVWDMEAIENRSDTEARIKKNVSQGEDRFESIHRRKDGSEYDVEVSIKYMPEYGGQFICFLRDITERKLTAQQLRQTNDKYQALLDNSPLLISEIGPEGSYHNVNSATARFIQQSPSELAGKTFDKLFPEETTKLFMQRIARVLEGKEPITVEDRLGTSENERHFLTTLYPIIDEYGEVTSIGSIAHDITDQKQAEQALREGEQYLQAILQTTVDGFWTLDMSGNLVEVNNAYSQMSGYTKDELLSMNISELDFVETPQNMAIHIEKILTNGFDTFETKHMKKNGTLFDAEISVSYLYREGGRLICFCRDISDRKKDENLLKESEKNLRQRNEFIETIINNLPIGLAANRISDQEITFINPAFESIYGWPQESFKSIEHFFECVYPDPEYRQQLTERVMADIMSGYPERMVWDDLIATGKDGSHKYIKGQNIPLPQQDLMISTVLDVTDRKQAEILVEQSEEKYRALYENAPLSYQSLDENGCFLDVNPTWLKTLGYERNEVIGKCFKDFLHPDWKPHFEKNFPEFKKRGYVHDVQFKIKHKNGQYRDISFEGCIGHYPDGSFRETYCVFKDITEEKKAEEALEKSEAMYRTLIDAVPDIVMRFDPEGRHLFVSENVSGVVDFSPESFIGKTHRELGFSGQHCSYWEGAIQRVCSSGIPYETEFAFDGGQSTIIFNWRLVPEFDAQGAVQSVLSICRDVTAQQRAEQNYQMLFKQMIDGFAVHEIICNDDGKPVDYKFISVNPAFEKMTGLKEEDIQGWNVRKVLPSIEQSWIDTYGRVALTGEPAQFEEHTAELGKYIQVSAFRNAPMQFACIFVDITEQKQNENLLSQSEERYKTAERMTHLGSWEMDIATGKSIWSDEFYRICGYKPRSIEPTAELGMQIIHPDDRERAAKAVNDTITTGKPYDIEKRILRPDGIIRWVHSVGEIIYDEDETPYKLSGSFLDITESKQAEQSLRESEERFRVLIESSPMSVLLMQNGKYIYGNPASAQLLGYDDTKDVIGKDAIDTIAPEFRDVILERMKTVESGLSNSPFEIQVLRPSGERAWSVSRSVSLNIDGKKTVVIIGQDITELKKAEEERDIIQRQLTQAQKMEAVGRLAGGVAHDFNNMLNVILGNTELIMSEFDSDNPLFEDLQEIHKATERSSNLTRQLLAFARKQTITPQLLNLNETISGMLKMLQRLIGEDIKLVWIPGEELWTVRMDPGQIDQILANLCVNSRDAISDVGMITIVTKNTQCDQSFCDKNPSAVPGEYVKITVTDTGKGMDAETLANAFEPFYTTKDINEGTGLGLSTVYGIAKQNNSFITISSQLGHGTSIELFMPRHIGKAEQLSKIPDKQTDATGNETILLVEDEKSLLRLGKRTLTQLGYEVLAAASPVEAIQIASEYSGIIQVLITDVVMPEMNGRDLAKRIISMYPDIKCLFMSGYTADVIAHRGVLDTGVNFIQKPYTKSVLAAKVEDMLRSEN